jgi:predicted amidohydrolase
MKIGFAQINPTVGDLRGNFEKIAGAYASFRKIWPCSTSCKKG